MSAPVEWCRYHCWWRENSHFISSHIDNMLQYEFVNFSSFIQTRSSTEMLSVFAPFFLAVHGFSLLCNLRRNGWKYSSYTNSRQFHVNVKRHVSHLHLFFLGITITRQLCAFYFRLILLIRI